MEEASNNIYISLSEIEKHLNCSRTDEKAIEKIAEEIWHQIDQKGWHESQSKVTIDASDTKEAFIYISRSPKEYKFELVQQIDEDQAKELEERLLERKRLDRSVTWSSRWVASPVAYLFPKRWRDESLADLREVSNKMLNQEHYPRWMINIVVIVRTIVLLSSALKIQISDLFSTFKRRVD